uniref:Uncharacterized protein n=1 Tax=Chrysemys picta bellii TaxID=8478 RepID=A0A8C3FDH5_CHRPI
MSVILLIENDMHKSSYPKWSFTHTAVQTHSLLLNGTRTHTLMHSWHTHSHPDTHSRLMHSHPDALLAHTLTHRVAPGTHTHTLTHSWHMHSHAAALLAHALTHCGAPGTLTP